MALSTLNERKIEEFVDHTIVALNFYFEEDFEHALGDFRKSCEALMKILIIERFGDIDAEKIIFGEIDENLMPNSRIVLLDYQGFLKILKILAINTDGIQGRLKDVQTRSNPAAHNPNAQHDYRADAELCKVQVYELSLFLFKRFNKTMPKDLVEAFLGNVNSALILSMKATPWSKLMESVGSFSSLYKYILIAPPKFTDVDTSQLEVLARVNWSFVIDFDPSTKERGIYKAFEDSGITGFIPLTIKQKGQRNITGSGSSGSINWLFANGVKTIPDTITDGVKRWRNAKYHFFIKEVLNEFFSKNTNQYVLVYLFDDAEYIEEIVRIISEVEILPQDLVQHTFLTTNSDKADRILRFDRFNIHFEVIDLDYKSFLSGVTSSLKKTLRENTKYNVPARTRKDENAVVNIGDIYNRLLGDDISVVYESIHLETANDLVETTEFFKGEHITWRDLYIDVEVKRYHYLELVSKLKNHLLSTKKSIKFEILHKPGAGGTTISYRLAYELRLINPTIVIGRFDKGKTYKSLSVFLDRVNKPVLAIVEASDVDLNDLEDLIRTCNTNKVIVCFVYVKRVLKLERSTEFSFFLNDAMVDLAERDKFLNVTKLNGGNKEILMELQSRQVSECEVIDFSLSINEEGYSQKKLIEYIAAYIEKLPENEVKFTVFSCFIYYYSQKKTSELIFRSLFKKVLTEDLKKVAVKEQYIRKILIQDFDQNTYTYNEYWRPRFSKFAEAVLICVLGKNSAQDWKKNIASYSLEFIELFKRNNEFLVDETQALLQSVFFHRNNEDLLGVAEQWKATSNNDQFSQLLRDIENKQKQKAILVSLVSAYPNHTHFLGHLGRFIYEKAEELAEFKEANDYINRAIEEPEGIKDFNLHHIGGMCKRREIEFLYRDFKKNGTHRINKTQLIELAELSNTYFSESIRLNPFNVHAYVAQIQTLLEVIDFGREISGSTIREIFLTIDDNRWYLDQYMTVKRLIETARILIENQETLGITNKIVKTKNYINSGEAKSFEVIGSYEDSTRLYLSLIETAERSIRPQVRLMYIYSVLMAKVKGEKKNIHQAWGKLKTNELNNFNHLFKENILQDGSNFLNLRMWFKFVRYSSIDISIEEIINHFETWYEHSSNFRLMHLEATFYLYVLHSYLVISRGNSFNLYNRTQAEKYIQECRIISNNTKHPFEYLGKENGIDAIINHRDRAYFDDEQLLLKVEGTISVITSRQTGKVVLKSGLEAFFVPYAGNFIQNQDETLEVTFFVGFRHDGLIAIDVKRLNQIETIEKNKMSVEITNQKSQSVERIEIIEEQENQNQGTELGPQKFKIVGKIDISSFENPRRKK